MNQALRNKSYSVKKIVQNHKQENDVSPISFDCTVGSLWTNVLYSLIIVFEMVWLSVNFIVFGGYGNQTAEM